MKKLLVLLLSIIVLNCSKDDNNPADNSFLENYDGIGWISLDDNFVSYLRFVDNQNLILEMWTGGYNINNEDCFWHHYLTDDLETGDILEIIENKDNILKLRLGNSSDYILFNCTVLNNTLTIEWKWYYDGDGYNYHSHSEKTSVDLDALNKCAN